jgi:hypothetical protein
LNSNKIQPSPIENLKMNHISERQLRFISKPFIITLLISALVILISFSKLKILLNIVPSAAIDDDLKYYHLIASGKLNEVIYPFSNRLLYPLAAGFITLITGISINFSFLLLNLISLVGIIYSITWYFKKESNSSLLSFFILSPLLCFYFQFYYMPDLFFSFLLMLFVISIRKNNLYSICGLLMLLYLTKETALIVTLVLLPIYWFGKEKRSFVIVLIISILMLIVNQFLQYHYKPNIHQLNNILYLVLKMGYNFLYNIGGIRLWSNTFSMIPCEPVYFMNLEKYHIFGQIKSVGFCSFDIYRPLATLSILLSVFGILLSGLIFFIRKNKIKTLLTHLPTEVLFSLILGVLLFLVGTSSGSWVYRLVGYGWPAFWIATIYFISTGIAKKQAYIILLIVQLCFSWIPWFFNFDSNLQSPFLYFEYKAVIITFFFVCIFILVITIKYFNRISNNPKSDDSEKNTQKKAD